MRFQIFIFVLNALLISACQQKESMNGARDNEKIISKELLVSIFEELVLVESHLQSKYYSYANYGESLLLSRDSLLRSKGVTLKQFTTSFDFYSKTDEDLVILYQEVLNDYNEKSAKAVIKSN